MRVANRTLLMTAAVALGAVLISASAQSQTRADRPQPVPEERRTQPTGPDESTTAPQQGTSTAPSGSLSDELSRSGGVLQPPMTGDQGVVPPPKTGSQSTPVIPPPGTPGGNPEIRPK